MTEEPKEYEIFINKRTDRIYISKSFDAKQLSINENRKIEEIIKPLRIASKIVETKENHEFVDPDKVRIG